MGAIYPYKWNGQFDNAIAVRVAKNEWYDSLNDFSDEDIKRGISVCKKSGAIFPPSIPEFVKMCTPTPEDFGILDEERAYKAFCNKDFSNPVVSMTEKALQPQSFDMAQMWAKEHKKTFLTQYRICSQDYTKTETPSRYAAIFHTGSYIKRLIGK